MTNGILTIIVIFSFVLLYSVLFITSSKTFYVWKYNRKRIKFIKFLNENPNLMYIRKVKAPSSMKPFPSETIMILGVLNEEHVETYSLTHCNKRTLYWENLHNELFSKKWIVETELLK